MQPVVDLRSDTVTKPTAAMRQAMAEAAVGDDVYDDDPTVQELEQRVAALLGQEAALFMPSGTMANQVALRSLGNPGESVIIGENAHVWRHESGALAALAGLQTSWLPGGGMFTASDVRAAYQPNTFYLSPTTVLAVENTHNSGGGSVWPQDQLRAVIAEARALGLRLHLDGARLWNAAVATGLSVQELSQGFDTVSVCLSKGLGAPVGSVLASSRERLVHCRRLRKMYGGGMRQVGILAAAGLYALDHHRARLVEDHRRARTLADGLRRDGMSITEPQTNIVMIHGAFDAAAIAQAAKRQGVLLSAFGPSTLRLVTHLDVGDQDIARAIDVVKPLLYA